MDMNFFFLFIIIFADIIGRMINGIRGFPFGFFHLWSNTEYFFNHLVFGHGDNISAVRGSSVTLSTSFVANCWE